MILGLAAEKKYKVLVWKAPFQIKQDFFFSAFTEINKNKSESIKIYFYSQFTGVKYFLIYFCLNIFVFQVSAVNVIIFG